MLVDKVSILPLVILSCFQCPLEGDIDYEVRVNLEKLQHK